MDRAGSVYVVQHNSVPIDTIQKYDANGTFVCEWGQTGAGPGGIYQAWCIEVDPVTCDLYVSDEGNNHNRVSVFQSQTRCTGKVFGVFVGAKAPPELLKAKTWMPQNPHDDARALRAQLDLYWHFEDTSGVGVPEVLELYTETDGEGGISNKYRVQEAIQKVGSLVSDGDMFVFYYSGHGGNGNDEGDPGRQTLGVGRQMQLFDTELTQQLRDYLPQGCSIVVILDTCHSGGFWPEISALGEERVAFLASTTEDRYSTRNPFTGRGLYTSHLIAGLQPTHSAPSHPQADAERRRAYNLAGLP